MSLPAARKQAYAAAGGGVRPDPSEGEERGQLPGGEEVVAEPPARTEKEAQDRADAILVSSQQGLVEATGTTIGLPDLRAGRTVNIRGTGYHFDGRYAVVSSTHTLGDNGYRTSFTARRVGPDFAS